MKIAIMQPTFMPWAGYFALINYVDKFVFLNDVNLILDLGSSETKFLRITKQDF